MVTNRHPTMRSSHVPAKHAHLLTRFWYVGVGPVVKRKRSPQFKSERHYILSTHMESSIAPDVSDASNATAADSSVHISAGLQLPACQRCRLRKVRCDRSAPKCANCTKSNVACIIVDPETGEKYARDYLRRLQEEEAALKAQLGDCTIPPDNAVPCPCA